MMAALNYRAAIIIIINTPRLFIITHLHQKAFYSPAITWSIKYSLPGNKDEVVSKV